MTRLRILGSAAGGGFPQWNCGCEQCAGVREGTLDARPRTQLGAAVSAREGQWALLGASPDLRGQIEGFPVLHPRAPRHTPIAGVVLTNGDLDGCLGLFSLRESQPLHVWTTDSVREGLERNAMIRTLDRFAGHCTWHRLEPGKITAIAGFDVEVVAAPGKVPRHLEGLVEPTHEDNVGLVLHDGRGARIGWFPCVGAASKDVLGALERVDAVYFDGTFWSSDELSRQGLGTASAEAMAHWPLSGPHGSLHALARSPARTKVLVHVNNSNPILRESSPERAKVEGAGIEVAHDAMEHAW